MQAKCTYFPMKKVKEIKRNNVFAQNIVTASIHSKNSSNNSSEAI